LNDVRSACGFILGYVVILLPGVYILQDGMCEVNNHTSHVRVKLFWRNTIVLTNQEKAK